MFTDFEKKEYQKAYAEKNEEKVKERQKKYREKNKSWKMASLHVARNINKWNHSINGTSSKPLLADEKETIKQIAINKTH